MRDLETDRPEPGTSRRGLLRAGLAGAAGLGTLAAGPELSTAHAGTYGPGDTCPAWPMGTTTSNGQTIYLYYCYQFDSNCMPIFTSGSTLESTEVLNCGCQGNCLPHRVVGPHGGLPPVPSKSVPATTKTTDMTAHYWKNLENDGTADFMTSYAFPDPNNTIKYNVIHQYKDTGRFFQLLAVKIPFTIQFNGPTKVEGFGVAAIGREVSAPRNTSNVEKLDADPSCKVGRHRKFRHDVNDGDIGTAFFHVLFKTDLPSGM
jgi:hypothetical protein